MSEVIELNQHRLLNGDATNKDDVAKLIGDCKVNLLLTDPPYGIDIVKIGGGKLVDKVAQPSDHSIEREREQMATIGGAKPPTFKRNSGNSSKTRIPQRRERERVCGKVGKPRRCTAKTLQTSNRR